MSRRDRKPAAQSAGSTDATADETVSGDDDVENDAESAELAQHIADAATPLVDENGDPVNPPDAAPSEVPGAIDHGASEPPALLDPDAPTDEAVSAVGIAPTLAPAEGLTRYQVHAHGTVQHNDVEYPAGSIVALPARAVTALVADGVLTEVK